VKPLLSRGFFASRTPHFSTLHPEVLADLHEAADQLDRAVTRTQLPSGLLDAAPTARVAQISVQPPNRARAGRPRGQAPMVMTIFFGVPVCPPALTGVMYTSWVSPQGAGMS